MSEVDKRLSDARGRPVGGLLPYWFHELHPEFVFLWHTGFALQCPIPVTFPRNPTANMEAGFKFFLGYTSILPKKLAVSVFLACRMVESMGPYNLPSNKGP